MRLYYFVLVILIVQNESLATDSQNTILSNFEEPAIAAMHSPHSLVRFGD